MNVLLQILLVLMQSESATTPFLKELSKIQIDLIVKNFHKNYSQTKKSLIIRPIIINCKVLKLFYLYLNERILSDSIRILILKYHAFVNALEKINPRGDFLIAKIILQVGKRANKVLFYKLAR